MNKMIWCFIRKKMENDGVAQLEFRHTEEEKYGYGRMDL